MHTRRALLKAMAALGLMVAGIGAYAVGIEPRRHKVTRYRPQLPKWPQNLKLRIAVIADIHACEPWMDLDRVGQIVADTNALAPDLILLLGDYMAHHRFVGRPIAAPDWAKVLADL
jgi:predicted MPP superfamily phosphohydrolase